MKKHKQALYLSYTGMLEPLGRSQVFSYLSKLSGEYLLTLISFEKPVDFHNEDAVRSLVSEYSEHGIDWRPQKYHHRPRLLATIWDLTFLLLQTLRHSWHKEVELIHCRSYVPAIAAWLCGMLSRKPFIFDMRAIWPDEMVTAGRLREASLTYKMLKWVERRLLHSSAKVVSLTESAVDYLLEQYPELPRDKFEVITTCVDIDRFFVPDKHSVDGALKDRDSFTVGTMGTLLSGWFYLDAFFSFFLEVKKLRPNARASIITRDDHQQILQQAEASGVDVEDIKVVAASPDEMPDYLAEMDVGVMFYAPDVGRAPTRLAEFLATGVPVVGNTGIGDLARLIEHYRVGVVVDEPYDQNALAMAAYELFEKYDSILISQTCRHAAEDYFTAEKGADRYRQIYREIS